MSSLLAGLCVVDLAGEPAAMTGRLLADLGAEVVRVEAPGGDPLRDAPPYFKSGNKLLSLRFEAWNAGKSGLCCSTDDPRLEALLARADLVVDTPGWPGVLEIDPSRAPNASWIRVTPFGLEGPRSGWRASDLGVMAASGNMFSTGFPDRAPVRCTEATAYAHAAAEAAFAAVTAAASARPQIVDVSMQEAVQVSNMGGPLQCALGGSRGRRVGANIGRTREIWKCKDGYVTFGLRGGPARVPSLRRITQLLVENEIASKAWTQRDWASWNPNESSDEDMQALEEPLVELFARYEMQELQELAFEANLMLAAANSPREVYSSAQLQARAMFAPLTPFAGFPVRVALASSKDGSPQAIRARSSAPALGDQLATAPAVDADSGWRDARGVRTDGENAAGAWQGVKILEFGSGAAGPIATRYFAEQGATVIKVESRSRPDFLRIYALGPNNPHGLEGSVMFNSLNVSKQSLALNLKNPQGAELAKRLIGWSDAVLENFAPKAMRGFGLDYSSLVRDKPDLVMLSSCMNGQTGPHRDYPGFGAQGSALACFNYLTGWPDRDPIGPYATITDSLSPRFAAALLGAALLQHRRTGRGVHIDLSQVEAGLYCLSPWLLDFANNGVSTMRMGNRSQRCAPHGAFPCRAEGELDDRWVAIAIWNDDEWARLAKVMGVDEPRFSKSAERLEQVDAVEALVTSWTRELSRTEVSERLQKLGIEAVPVLDFADLLNDPQLAHRGHFVSLDHSVLGTTLYQRNGIRMGASTSGYPSPSPTLGQHSREVLSTALGVSEAELMRLEESGVVE